MNRTLEHWLNHALDRRVTWGLPWRGHVIPAFQLWAGLGLTIAITAALALAGVRGLSAAWMATAIAAAAAACFVFALGYKVITGEERLAFLHHVGLAIGAAALVLRGTAEPLLAYVEIVAVCFGLLLAMGRLGCLYAGCCHGRPHHWGVRYGERHVEAGFPPSMQGIRLVPVQLLESGWAGLVSAACLIALAAGAPTGLTLACLLPLYALGRFGAELLRGDSVRTWWGPLSEAQWICIGLSMASLLCQGYGGLPSISLSAGLAASALVPMLAAIASRRMREWAQPFHPRDMIAIAEAVRMEDAPGPLAVRSTRRGWQFSRGWIKAGEASCMHWAVSGFPGEPRLLGSLARLLIRLEGLPDDTPIRVDPSRSVTHILAFPAGLREESS